MAGLPGPESHFTGVETHVFTPLAIERRCRLFPPRFWAVAVGLRCCPVQEH
jgi:hypothetical protein